MEIIIHRINTVKKLKLIPLKYGTEIDVRSYNNKLILAHAPFIRGDILEDYLKNYNHGTLVVNIKEAGIEDEVLSLVRQRPQIKSYFLLDIEFPYIYRATRQGERAIAIRFSEEEPIEFAKKFVDKIDWVWIDTNTQMPVGEHNLPILNRFKKCLVCPERWGRPSDIANYKNLMSVMGFKIDAVMTSNQYIKLWDS